MKHSTLLALAIALLLAAAGSHGAPTARPGPPVYEYRVVAFSPAASSDQIEAALNQLGGEGWELVGVRSARFLYAPGKPDRRIEGEGVQAFFKRRQLK